LHDTSWVPEFLMKMIDAEQAVVAEFQAANPSLSNAQLYAALTLAHISGVQTAIHFGLTTPAEVMLACIEAVQRGDELDARVEEARRVQQPEGGETS